MGDINIFNAAKSGVYSVSYELTTSTKGNKSHYRNINGQYFFPEMALVFPQSTVTFIGEPINIALTGIPIIFRLENSINNYPDYVQNYRINVYWSMDKTFKYYFDDTLKDINYHFLMDAFFTVEQVFFRPIIGGHSGYVARTLKEKTLFFTTIYYFVSLTNTNNITGPTSEIASFNINFRKPEYVEGYIFPDITNKQTFYENGYAFDGNVYYGEL